MSRHEPFEVYRLEGNGYVRQMHSSVLIPEINLAIGRGQGSDSGWNSSWLYWYEFDGNRLPSPLEWAQQAQLQAQQEQQLKEDLKQRWLKLGDLTLIPCRRSVCPDCPNVS